MAVRVVTDSSARLSDDDRRRWHIRQVPLHILVDGCDLRDGVDEIAADICERPDATTAGASPGELEAVFAEVLSEPDCDGVVAVHLSAVLSSTCNAAEFAARHFDGAVRVVDSRSAAMGTGLVALAAGRAATGGASLDEVEAQARSAADRVRAFVVVHRLDNLRRSGRISTAASWLSTALAIKPLLRIDADGRLVLAQRIRTKTRALAAMADLVVEEVGQHPVLLAVQHVDNPQAAKGVAEALAERLNTAAPPRLAPLGPVLGVHVGRGAVAVAVDPAP